VLLFGLIIFGAAAAADAADGERWWGYLLGGLFCAIMVAAALRGRHH
jgi:hypothetical protein